MHAVGVAHVKGVMHAFSMIRKQAKTSIVVLEIPSHDACYSAT